MNTHDIKLPPLPPLCIAPSVEPVDYPDVAQALVDYALAAVEADRQRRGEPWMPVESCPGGNGMRYLFVRDCGQGTLPAVEMGYMLDADTEVYMDSTHEPFTKYGYRVTHWMHLPGLPNTPQPAEPCASSVSDKTACGSANGDCDSQPAEPVKHKRRYAQGTALGEFGIIPMCDQVDDEPVKVPSDLPHALRDLVAIWRKQQSEYPAEGALAAAAVRLCANELELLLFRYGQQAQPIAPANDAPTPEEEAEWQRLEKKNE